MTNEHIKQTYRFVSLETGMNTLKASWYAAIWCNTDEIKPLWHSQNKDMVKKNKGGTELSEQPQRAAVVQEVQLEGFDALCYTSWS